MAPLGVRRSSRPDAEVPPPLDTSTMEIDVTSAVTVAIGARGSFPGESLLRSSILGAGGAPPPSRPLTAAAYKTPLSSKRSDRIS